MASVRINRIIGQLKGIDRMILQKRGCNEILQQIKAVKKAINGLSQEIIVSDICRYVPDKNRDKVDKTIKNVIGL